MLLKAVSGMWLLITISWSQQKIKMKKHHEYKGISLKVAFWLLQTIFTEIRGPRPWLKDQSSHQQSEGKGSGVRGKKSES